MFEKKIEIVHQIIVSQLCQLISVNVTKDLLMEHKQKLSDMTLLCTTL